MKRRSEEKLAFCGNEKRFIEVAQFSNNRTEEGSKYNYQAPLLLSLQSDVRHKGNDLRHWLYSALVNRGKEDTEEDLRECPSGGSKSQLSNSQSGSQLQKSGDTETNNGRTELTVKNDIDTLSALNRSNNDTANNGCLTEVKKQCTDCPENPFLICQDISEIIITSLQSNPPRFVFEINKFIKSHKLRSSLKIHCANCSSGPINDWDQVIYHLIGKAHKNKVKNKNSKYLKFLLCSTCFKVQCYNLPEQSSDFRDLPENLNELFKNIFPFAKIKGNIETVNKKKLDIKKKSPEGVDVIFSNLRNCVFSKIFEEVAKFGNNHLLNLQSLVFVTQPKDQIAFCRYNRSSTGIVKDKHINRNLLINGCRVKTEVVPSFDSSLQKVIDVKDFQFTLWSLGSLTPLCEIFKQWDQLDRFINSKIVEMNETRKEYNRLTAVISGDLRRAVAGSFTVKAIDFFGSRVTGLALSQSDFDLQISIGESCTVRALSDRCLDKSPWFTVKHVIPWAKVPVTKVLHQRSQTMCDISLNNMNGVINSQLLRFYLDIDKRVKWLVVTVKTWASMNLITGSFAFTSYSLAWLVLFFLMQKEISLVPAVEFFTKLQAFGSRNHLYSQETGKAFNLDMGELFKVHNPKLKCRMSKYQLLVEFFGYYTDVIASKFVLDPYTGDLISRKCILESNQRNLTKGNLNNDKNVHAYSLIIVDPIKHSSNISATVSSKLLNDFIHLAQSTLDILSRSHER